jgi:hypothetical protein
MMTLVCFVLLSILAIRSLILMLMESKPFLTRLLDLFFVLLFGTGAFAILLFSGFQPFQDPALAILVSILVAMPVALSMILRFRRPYDRKFVWVFLKTLLLLLILFVCVVALMTSGFIRLTEDRPVMKITMTGIQRKEDVTWKSPQGSLRKEALVAYEVLLETPEEKPIADLYVYGDQVAIKARVIRFRPILNVVGLSNLCHVDFVFNGYKTAERHNAYPHRAQVVSSEPVLLKPYQKPFWDFWERLYYLKGQNWLIKSATLESNFFPLVDAQGAPFQGSYYLTITSGGLSSKPASNN